MKIYLPFDFETKPRDFLRRAGYGELTYSDTGKTSYVNRLARDNYPRFHAYVKQDKDNRQVIDLHLDQKKPSYAGSRAHSAEYEGGRVEIEAKRLEGLVKNQMDNQTQKPVVEEKQGFFSKLFK